MRERWVGPFEAHRTELGARRLSRRPADPERHGARTVWTRRLQGHGSHGEHRSVYEWLVPDRPRNTRTTRIQKTVLTALVVRGSREPCDPRYPWLRKTVSSVLSVAQENRHPVIRGQENVSSVSSVAQETVSSVSSVAQENNVIRVIRGSGKQCHPWHPWLRKTVSSVSSVAQENNVIRVIRGSGKQCHPCDPWLRNGGSTREASYIQLTRLRQFQLESSNRLNRCTSTTRCGIGEQNSEMASGLQIIGSVSEP